MFCRTIGKMQRMQKENSMFCEEGSGMQRMQRMQRKNDALRGKTAKAKKFVYQRRPGDRERAFQAHRGVALEKLELLDEVDYDKQAGAVAEDLGMSRSALDKEIARRRDRLDAEAEPWNEPVKGDRLLDELCTVIKRHVVLEEEYVRAIDAWTHSPILMVTSPVKGCGKTTVLDLLEKLVPSPYQASNATPAAIFNLIHRYGEITLMLDEGETFIHGKGELRGIIDSGHKRTGAKVIRAHQEHSTWAPKVIALIGGLPATVEDRSIKIEMHKKSRKDNVKLVSHRANVYSNVRRRCLRWARDNIEQLRDLDPEFPKGVRDRVRDNWRPLLAIAQQCGAEWPVKARNACRQIQQVRGEDEDIPILLLQDLRMLFDKKKGGNLASTEIVHALTRMDHRPWPDYHSGKLITGRGVAKLLKAFKIQPRQVPVGDKRPNCYAASWFEKVF
jgi:hypothetical protein